MVLAMTCCADQRAADCLFPVVMTTAATCGMLHTAQPGVSACQLGTAKIVQHPYALTVFSAIMWPASLSLALCCSRVTLQV